MAFKRKTGTTWRRHHFRDDAGNAWYIVLDDAAVKNVRERTGIDLAVFGGKDLVRLGNTIERIRERMVADRLMPLAELIDAASRCDSVGQKLPLSAKSLEEATLALFGAIQSRWPSEAIAGMIKARKE